MKRIVLGMASMLFAVSLLTSCSDDDESTSVESNVSMYGLQYSFTSGVIWQNNPHDLVTTVPYIYKDTYTTDSGTEVTDEVEGFTFSSDSKQVGNFMISLYEDGLTFNGELSSTKGTGACICFHMNSEDVNSLSDGKYVYGNENEPGTFVAYASSEYSTSEKVTPAVVDSGYVNVSHSGDEYSVEYEVRTTFGGIIKGVYKGQLAQCRVPQVESAEYSDIKLMGLLDQTYVTYWIYGYNYGTATDYDNGTNSDFNNGYALFSLTSGMAQTAYGSRKAKDKVDIAMKWDEANSQFRMESPIVMRKYLGHDSYYDFPCHTIYMKAPSSFTDDDFENLSSEDFATTITDEEVTIPVTTPDDFQPVYVFFKTGNGVQGVIRFKQYFEGYSTILDRGGAVTYEYPVNPSLLMDVKCPAVVANPQIR